MGASSAAASAQALIDAGALGLMSFGLAGGLDPELRAGSIVVPSEVISPAGVRFATSPDWRARLVAALGATPVAKKGAQRPVIAGALLTSALPIDTLEAKARAFEATGAVAVDMESLAVAEVAAGHSLPFIAVRVIIDTAADVVPRAVVAASAGGQVRIGRLLGELALAPVECLALIRLARRYRVATRAMAAVAADIRAA
jgi:adenosylhomocysteine nucleosidase